MPRRLKNVRRWKSGWQAYTQVGGKTLSKSFPLSTPTEEMRTWIRETRDRHSSGPKATHGSFAEDIVGYLTRVTAMPTYKQRVQHLEMWAKALGRERTRRSITTAEIDRVIQDWLLSGSAAGTVRKRRASLLSMWNRLDGPSAQNPIRTSHAPREPKPEARGLPYETVQRILDAMYPSKNRIRLTVLAWTGLPPGMLLQVKRDDINFEAKTLRVRPRRKGAGVEARTLPLLPQAVDALRTFVAAGLCGEHFDVHAMNQAFRRACGRLDPPLRGVTVYWLRHSWGTMLYSVTRDLATVARFMLHANVAMSERYAKGALATVDRAAIESAEQFLSSKSVL